VGRRRNKLAALQAAQAAAERVQTLHLFSGTMWSAIWHSFGEVAGLASEAAALARSADLVVAVMTLSSASWSQSIMCSATQRESSITASIVCNAVVTSGSADRISISIAIAVPSGTLRVSTWIRTVAPGHARSVDQNVREMLGVRRIRQKRSSDAACSTGAQTR